jgi:hypothetical protein
MKRGFGHILRNGRHQTTHKNRSGDGGEETGEFPDGSILDVDRHSGDNPAPGRICRAGSSRLRESVAPSSQAASGGKYFKPLE